MKLSYECSDVISELLEDIWLYGLNEPCCIIKQANKSYYSDYLLKKEMLPNMISTDESFVETTLFKALTIFIEQNSVIERGQTAYKLIAVRNIAQLSQTAIAVKLGVNPKNYAKWETGERNPKLDTIVNIAKICNINPSVFL